MSDYIERQAAIDALFGLYEYQRDIDPTEAADLVRQGIYLAEKKIDQLPSAQPEQRYTEDELRVFQHGISLSLLSKRSSQHWQYDEDTATEIKFLERLYEKVGADIRGE